MKNIIFLFLLISCNQSNAATGVCKIKVDSTKTAVISPTLKDDCLKSTIEINIKMNAYLEYKKSKGCKNLSDIINPLKATWNEIINPKNEHVTETQPRAEAIINSYLESLCNI